MFDAEFFPTPYRVVDQMLEPYYIDAVKRRRLPEDWTILEPSAGKGDILDRICGLHNNRASRSYRLYAIEQSPELVHILQGKGYKVLGNDFLTFMPEHHFDLIVMNPPFSNGDEHLLHAWEILEDGHIACLLNSETIRNPCTARRKLLATIISKYGSVQELGSCFVDAERKTSVEVSVVRLKKVRAQRNPLEFEFDGAMELDKDLEVDKPEAGTEIMMPDRVGAWIRQYEKAKEAFVSYLKAMDALNTFGDGLIHCYHAETRDSMRRSSVQRMAWDVYGSEATNTGRFNEFRDVMSMQVWKMILGKMGVEKYLTSDLTKKFDKFLESAGALSLTKENIYNVCATIVGNSDEIMKQAVVTVFDEFTRYHACNQVHVEGWKTNQRWKCNRKIILPHWVSFSWVFSFSTCRRDAYEDIDKALSWLDGRRIEDIVTISMALHKDFNETRQQKCESTFFKIRYFKKGTVHLEFKDTKLWDRFNKIAVEGKNWLGNEEQSMAG